MTVESIFSKNENYARAEMMLLKNYLKISDTRNDDLTIFEHRHMPG
jgi:hypothetical protein